MVPQRVSHSFIGEDGFDTRLRVVEIAPDSAYPDVSALLRGHLQLLHRADAILGIEDQDPGMGGVAEALQRRLSGVAGGSHQDDDLPSPCFGSRYPHEMGQDLERHVLEGAGRARATARGYAAPLPAYGQERRLGNGRRRIHRPPVCTGAVSSPVKSVRKRDRTDAARSA